MKLWLLDTGSLVIEHTQLMWNVPGAQVRIPSYGVLVESDDSLLLVDTGFDLEHTRAVLPFELPEQAPEQTIPAQLEACGFSTSDVATLVNSHLHFDHVGGNKHVAGASVVVHERELAQARNHEPFEFYGYSDTSWDNEGARFEPVSGDFEVTKGLHLFETPGHTVGHYSLLVEPASGRRPMLFAFDVVYTQAAYEREIQAGFHVDPVAGVRSIRRIKRLAEDHGADVYFSHDMEAWQTYKHAPDFYEL
ncbi:MAG: N-acyl homoserine lactonase family protein [Actinomycetota bacterium]|nr:N-acyl homoserine lactonase family protein [Actinomycetota bacterium]